MEIHNDNCSVGSTPLLAHTPRGDVKRSSMSQRNKQRCKKRDRAKRVP